MPTTDSQSGFSTPPKTSSAAKTSENDRALLAALEPGLAALALPACIIGPDMRFSFANRAYVALFQQNRSLDGIAVHEVFGDANFCLVEPYLAAALACGKTSTFRQQSTDAQGVKHWMELQCCPYSRPDGAILGVILSVIATVSIVEDILEQEHALVDETSAHERLLCKLADSAGMLVAYLDSNFILRFANDSFFEWVGLSETDLLHRHFGDAFGRTITDFYLPLAKRAMAGETVAIDTLSRTHKGEPRHVHISFFPDRADGNGTAAIQVKGIFLLVRNIEKEYQLSQSLIAKEDELRELANNIGMPLFQCDRNLMFKYVNQVAADLAGYPVDEMVGSYWPDFTSKEQFEESRPHLEQGLSGKAAAYERQVKFKGRKSTHVRVNIMPWRDDVGAVVGLSVYVSDIDRDSRDRAELIERERQLKLITNNIGMPLSYIDIDERWRFYNQTGSDWTGLSETEMVGKRIDAFFPPEVMAAIRPYLTRAFAGEPQTYERLGDFPNRGKRWIRGHMIPDIQENGKVVGIFTVLTDIHDDMMLRQNLERQERQLRLFTDNIPEAIAYLDTERRYKFINNTFLELQGKSRHEVVGKTSGEVLGEAAAHLASPYVERALQGETVSYERLVKLANGAERWMRIRTVPDLGTDNAVQGIYVVGFDIHDAKNIEEALKTSEAELSLAMDSSPHPMSYIDRSFRYQLVNKQLEKVLGKKREQLIGADIAAIFGQERFDRIKPLLDKVLEGEPLRLEQLVTQQDGSQRWMILRCTSRRDAENNIIGFYSTSTDIDELKRTELELRHANWLLTSHFENTPMAVIEWDPDFRVRRWSVQAENVFGWKESELIGKRFNEWPFVPEPDLGTVESAAEMLSRYATPHATSLNRNYRKDGRIIWCEWYNSNLCDESGNIVSVLSLVQDVTARINAEERLVHQATHDSLTGLPNRAMLQERLRQAITRARRSGLRVAVLFVDLDRFKDINDTLGHRIGDELLREIALRLNKLVRETDLLVRLSGDEFMLVTEQIDEPRVSEAIATKLIDSLRVPVDIEGHEIHISGSVGISIFPDDANDPEALLKNADMAMYHAKAMGKNGYQLFSAELAEHGTSMRLMENALRTALRDREFELYYQPKIDMRSNLIIGAEALLRWHHPTRGLVMPGEFMQLVEENSLVHDVGNWVLDTALARLKSWHALAELGQTSFENLQMAVNISAGQFRSPNLAERIIEKITQSGCQPTAVEIELTETGLLRDPDGVGKTLLALRQHGVRVAIDDFGTGFSSLTHLKRFRIDSLKIDRSFVADILLDRDDAAIVSAVIALAHALEIEVVAEGVETEEQRALLTQQGCEAYQGYLFSPAVPAAEFEQMVKNQTIFPLGKIH